jgi:hypothetical protein
VRRAYCNGALAYLAVDLVVDISVDSRQVGRERDGDGTEVRRAGGATVVTLPGERRRAEQLAQLLDGELEADEARTDVRGLARLATSVADEIDPPTLDAAARDRLRERVLAEVHLDLAEAEQAPAAAVAAHRRPRTALATGLAAVVVAASGLTVAAQEALPGDLLYDVKQATESVRLAATSDATERGRLELALAERRLEEVTAAVDRGGVRSTALVSTLREMDLRSVAGAETLAEVAQAGDEPELLLEVVTFTRDQTDGIVAVYGDLPVTVRPHAEDSLSNLRAIREQIVDPVLAACERCRADLAPAGWNAETLAPLTSTPLPAAPPPAADGRTADEAEDSPAPGRSSGGGEVADEPPLPEVQVPTDDATTRRLVPRLPGPLDDAGRAVGEGVGSVVDEAGRTVEDTTGRVGDAVDDVTDGVGDVVDDTVDGAGGLIEDTVDGVGGLLGR